MENFENLNEQKNKNIEKRFFDKLNKEAENYIATKINKIVLVIENLDFNIDKAEIRIEKKVKKLKEDLHDKFFSDIDLDTIDEILERKILKLALESVAEKNLDGSLSFYENLENKYLEILIDEAKFFVENDKNLNNNNLSLDDIKNLVRSVNNKGILDKNLRAILVDKIKSNFN